MSWSVTTPHGQDDLTKHVMMHKDSHHPDMKMTEDEFKSKVKEIDVMTPPMKGEVTQKEEAKAWKTQENVGKRFRSDKKE